MEHKNLYKEYGKGTRRDYLQYLSDTYEVDLQTVEALADANGPNEDFDGLVNALEDLTDMQRGCPTMKPLSDHPNCPACDKPIYKNDLVTQDQGITVHDHCVARNGGKIPFDWILKGMIRNVNKQRSKEV